MRSTKKAQRAHGVERLVARVERAARVEQGRKLWRVGHAGSRVPLRCTRATSTRSPYVSPMVMVLASPATMKEAW